MGYRVGGDVDYRCTRCKLELAHTILAMVGGEPVQVKCNTCHTIRKYRNKSKRRTSTTTPKRSATRTATARAANARTITSRAPAPPSSEARTERWVELMAKADAGNVKRSEYNMRETYEVGQVIDHRKFGGGVVDGIVDRKIRVLFSDGERLLIHGRTA